MYFLIFFKDKVDEIENEISKVEIELKEQSIIGEFTKLLFYQVQVVIFQ
jgi:hypothetical protein